MTDLSHDFLLFGDRLCHEGRLASAYHKSSSGKAVKATSLSWRATLKQCVDKTKVKRWPDFSALSTRQLVEAMKIGAGT